MKTLPEVKLSWEPLRRMLHGAIPARLLLTAIDLKVFSLLTEPWSADAIADRLDTHPDNTRLFLDALAANELVCKRNGRYWNTPLSEAFLVEGQPTYLGDVLLDSAEWLAPALGSLGPLVKQGPPPAGRPPHSIAWPQEAEIRANCQRAGFAQSCAALVSQLPEFSSMGRMLDLGSGAGLIGLAIVASHPTMTGVLFDRAEVVEVAERFVRHYELQGRVTTVGGDYRTDSIGAGYDLIWTSYTLTHDSLDLVMRKIYEALDPGGVSISVAEALTHERTRPVTLVNSMLAMGLTSQHRMFEEGEVAQAMLRAGFRSVHSRVGTSLQPHGQVMVDVARK